MKYKNLKNSLLICLLIVLSQCTVYREQGVKKHTTIESDELYEKIPVKKLHRDMDYFLKMVEEVHIHPFLITSEEHFYNEFNKVKSGITEPLTRKEFYQRIAPLAGMIKASHTKIKFPREIMKDYKKNEGKFMPLDVKIENDKKVYVGYDYSQNNIPTGTEILAINGIETVDIVNKLLQYEAGSAEFSNIKRIQNSVPEKLWQIYDFEGPFHIKTPKNNYTIDGMTPSKINEIKKTKKAKKTNSWGGDNLTYKEIKPGVGLLTIKQFYKFKVPEFKDTIKGCFKQIQQDNITSLIIDVRGNQGGPDQCGEELCQYISDKPFCIFSKFLRKKSRQYNRYYRKNTFKPWTLGLLNIRTSLLFDDFSKMVFGSYVKIPFGSVDTIVMPLTQPRDEPFRFKGNVYVLIDQYCYSGTMALLAPVKDYKIGTLVGMESGESPGGYGEAYEFDLPNSHLYSRVSTTFSVRPNGDPDVTRGVIPDFEVKQTLEDTKNNEDTVLKYTLDLIGKKNKSN